MARLVARWCEPDGQALTEWVFVAWFMAMVVVAAMAWWISPIAKAFVAVAKKMVLNLGS